MLMLLAYCPNHSDNSGYFAMSEFYLLGRINKKNHKISQFTSAASTALPVWEKLANISTLQIPQAIRFTSSKSHSNIQFSMEKNY